MGNDEQLSMDLGVPVKQSEWDKWVDRERHAAQVKIFLKRAGLPELPQEPWDFESHEICGVNEMIQEILPDLASVTQPENADIIDQLVCFTGECFVRYLDARWIDLTDIPPGYNDTDNVSIYRNVKPGLAFPYPNWTTFTANILVEFVIENEFIELYELASVGYWLLRGDNDLGQSFSDMGAESTGQPPFI
ncbi:hypothetical protein [Nocardia colli]|uniref:hypothetical protein n=1 Tax=Nocardia colli TaxID=2545717 RepID=UPI0035DF2495